MINKNSEMSLDEVLSSIKKMVIDDEPPVLDLTDLVNADGRIVKVKSDDTGNRDMGAFLKLVQKNADSIAENRRKKERYIAHKLQEAPLVSADVSSCPEPVKTQSSTVKSGGEDAIFNLLNKIAVPHIKKWVDSNLPDITQQIVEEKILELLKNYQDK